MEKIKIIFDNTDYSIEQSSLDAIDDNLKTHLSTAMKGSGAVINMGDTAYDVDSTKLANAAAAFVAHLGLIAGEGSKVVVNGTEYAIGSDKVEGAIDNLHIVLGSLSSGESGGDDVVTVAAGLYETGSNYTVLVKDWDTLLNEGVVKVTDGAVGTGTNSSSLSGDLVLPNDGSITTLGQQAFSYCNSLTSITIPDSVTSIPYGTFSYCSSLSSITIPDSVTNIGEYAFLCCNSLTSIVIPDGVTNIGEYAFSTCENLASVTLSNSVVSIEKYAFTDCSSLTSILVTDGNQNYCDIDGVLFDKSKDTILCYPIGKTVSAYVIPDGVTSIGDYAFESCSSLTSITIPDSVTNIGKYAFQSCNGLTSIVIPDGVTSICKSTFSRCKNLLSVTIPNSVTSIDSMAFYSCIKLTSISFNGTMTEWISIEKTSGWNYDVPATEVVCSDGTVAL